MDRKLRFILVFVLLIFFAACEKKFMEPDIYIPDNADHAFMFERDLYTNNYNFTVGYNNGHIKSTSVDLNWNSNAYEQDENYLATKIYRDGNLIKTFNTKESRIYTDTGLVPNTYYRYTVANIVNTGMSVYDTLTVKTPSIAAPVVQISVPTDTAVKVFWKDMSDINGTFMVARQNIPITPAISQLNGVYSFVDDTVLPNNNYTYSIYKNGTYDITGTTDYSVLAQSYHNAPVLLNAIQVSNGVYLHWTDNSSAEDQVKIYRKVYGDPDSGFQVVGSILMPNQTEFVDTSYLLTGQNYTYAVSAVNRYLSPPVETDKSNTLSLLVSEMTISSFDFEDNDLNQFIMWGDAVWELDSIGNSKSMAARSGDLTDFYYGYSQMEYYCSAPYGAEITISFDYKVSSSSYNNNLFFLINQDMLSSWNTTPGWQHFSTTYTSNSYTSSFGWSYNKNTYSGGTTNTAWVDNIQISYLDSSGKKVYVDLGGQK